MNFLKGQKIANNFQDINCTGTKQGRALPAVNTRHISKNQIEIPSRSREKEIAVFGDVSDVGARAPQDPYTVFFGDNLHVSELHFFAIYSKTTIDNPVSSPPDGAAGVTLSASLSSKIVQQISVELRTIF